MLKATGMRSVPVGAAWILLGVSLGWFRPGWKDER